MPWNTGTSGREGYAKRTCSTSMRPREVLGRSPLAEGIAGVRSRISNTRSAAPSDFMKSAHRSVSPASDMATMSV